MGGTGATVSDTAAAAAAGVASGVCITAAAGASEAASARRAALAGTTPELPPPDAAGAGGERWRLRFFVGSLQVVASGPWQCAWKYQAVVLLVALSHCVLRLAGQPCTEHL